MIDMWNRGRGVEGGEQGEKGRENGIWEGYWGEDIGGRIKLMNVLIDERLDFRTMWGRYGDDDLGVEE